MSDSTPKRLTGFALLTPEKRREMAFRSHQCASRA